MSKKRFLVLLVTAICILFGFGNTYASSETSDDAQVLLDESDVLVEYRGIYEDSSSKWILNMYVENNRSADIDINLENKLFNGCAIGLGNAQGSVPANGKYLSAPNFDFVISVEDLEQYGITTIENISFTLQVKDAESREVIYETPVSIEVGSNGENSFQLLELAEENLGTPLDADGKLSVNSTLYATTSLFGHPGHFEYYTDTPATMLSTISFVYDEMTDEVYDSIESQVELKCGHAQNGVEYEDSKAILWDYDSYALKLQFFYGKDLSLRIGLKENNATSQEEVDRQDDADSHKGANKQDDANNQEDVGQQIDSETQEKPSQIEKTEKQATDSTSSKAPENFCQADGCEKEGTRSISGISGQTEWYCEDHYQEMMDILDMMEGDVGESSYSKHICEAPDCTKEGTHSIVGFSGETEYYCSQHYQEMVDIISMLTGE